MKSKKTLLVILSVVTSLACGAAVIFSNADFSILQSYKEPYGITFNSSKNKFFSGTGTTDYSGQAIIKTNNGNNIEFEYYSIAGGSSSAWHLVKNGGYFYNTDPIHGLESLFINCTAADKQYRISWGKDLSFDLGSQNYLSSVDPLLCDFNDDNPTYFKFENISGGNVSIKEMSVRLNCTNYYPSVSLCANHSEMGTVSGEGIKKVGDSVTIVAAPNQGYKFVGWYQGGSLVSSNSSYTFSVGNEDVSYVAHFAYNSYNFITESESLEKGNVSDSSGSYDYLSQITIEAYSNNGYSFAGWYQNSSLISIDNPYTFSMPSYDLDYTAKFSTNSYELSLSSNDSSLGSVTGSGTFLYGSNVTISATPNTGVAFLGWFDSKDDLVSEQKSYSFNMPYNNLEYTAKFEWVPHSISLSVNDDNMGFVSGSGSYHYGQSVTLTASPTSHHSFFGWYDGETLLSQESSYTFIMPNNSLEYEARFVKNYNLNVYSENEEMGTVVAPTEWGAGLEVTISAFSNEGYGFDYWCDGDYDEISFEAKYTFIMPEHSVEIIAVFAIGYCVTLDSNLNEDVVVLNGDGVYASNRLATIFAEGIDRLIFDGWFDQDYNLISTNNPYSFIVSFNIVLIAYYHYSSFNYEFGNFDESLNTCSLIGYSGSQLNDVVIPKLFEGKTVTTIGNSAFEYCHPLTSVVVPETITSIGEYSFYFCDSLTSIVMPDTIVSIGISAFGYCSSLKNIDIPNAVSSISKWTFDRCSSLAFINIHDSVKTIGYGAFNSCTSLTSIIIPYNVKLIDSGAFSSCYKLVEVINKSSLEITKGSLNHGGIAYYAKQVITSEDQSKVYIDDYGNVTYGDNGEWLVSYIGNDSSIIFPDSSTFINDYAFCGCKTLESIVISNNISSIGNVAFYGCTWLQTIIIPESVVEIGSDLFVDCNNLTIYCMASSKPTGWSADWNSTNRPVVWGYTPE